MEFPLLDADLALPEKCQNLLQMMLVKDPKSRPTVRELLQHPYLKDELDVRVSTDVKVEEVKVDGAELFQAISKIVSKQKVDVELVKKEPKR